MSVWRDTRSRQEDAAKLLRPMESQDESIYRLTDEQVEEVRQRMADPNRKLVSAAEARERIARLGGEADEAP